MTVASTANTKAKTEKHSGSSFGLPHSELPKIDLPKMEVPAAFRELADKSVAQARNTYENAKAATEEATEAPQGHLLRPPSGVPRTTTSRSLRSPVPIPTAPLITPMN